MANNCAPVNQNAITPKAEYRLLDSAMGTRLAALGLDFNTNDACLWNLTRPDEVLQCHAADLAAGADFLTTNTFGANRLWLEKFGRSDEIKEINTTAVALARRAFADQQKPAWIIGNIGPTALEEKSVFIEQAHCLRKAGAELLFLETLSVPQAMAASAWLRDVRLPVWMSLWHWGDNPVEVAKIMKEAGVARWGVNCMANSETIRSVFQTLFDANLPATIIKPSAMKTHAFIKLARQCQALGARYFGGCCGTDETYISALNRELQFNSTDE